MLEQNEGRGTCSRGAALQRRIAQKQCAAEGHGRKSKITDGAGRARGPVPHALARISQHGADFVEPASHGPLGRHVVD